MISYKLLGTQEWFVIHHTNCGMEFFTNEVMGNLLASSLDTAELRHDGFHDVGESEGSPEGHYVQWLTIADQEASVAADVARIRNHPLVPSTIPVHGYIYNVATGALEAVDTAA